MVEMTVNDRVIELRDNPYITEKAYGNISSFNFSRKAFYNDIWNEQTIKTRGLFINTSINKIVARSYNKFFEINDKRMYTPEMLKKEIVYPICCYKKENGFLGMLGYDNESDKLIFCTKSNIGGPFSMNFERILRKILSEDKLKEIKEYLKDTNTTMVFEVIDPVNDAHIIEYEQETAYLLDIVRNSFCFETYDYDKLQSIAARFNLKCKKLCCIVRNDEELKDLYYNLNDYDYKYNGNFIEGMVIIDYAGHMYKIKTNYYKFWKFMRNVKEAVEKYGEVRNSDLYIYYKERAEKIIEYMQKNIDKISDKNIIEIRKEMEGDV